MARHIYETETWKKHRFALAGGQSGPFLAPLPFNITANIAPTVVADEQYAALTIIPKGMAILWGVVQVTTAIATATTSLNFPFCTADKYIPELYAYNTAGAPQTALEAALSTASNNWLFTSQLGIGTAAAAVTQNSTIRKQHAIPATADRYLWVRTSGLITGQSVKGILYLHMVPSVEELGL